MWIYQNELEDGIDGLPKIPQITLAKARKNKELEWIKIGREIVYKREWIDAWLTANIRPISKEINDASN